MFSLSLNSVSKSFGRFRVFENLNFETEHAILGIQGANGSGKSTLLRCLAGLFTPSSGKIEWKISQNAIKQNDVRTHSGFAAPYINLYEELTIAENLDFLCKVRGLPFSIDETTQLLKNLGLDRKLTHSYKALSSGQQQRVKLASAFVVKPKILFLDEPGTNLDSSGKANLHKVVDDFYKNGSMVVIASNDPVELAWCTNTLSLN